MSRVYAREEETNRRFLLRIGCDAELCKATITPSPWIAESGWMKCGGKDEAGYLWQRDYCPDHTHYVPASCLPDAPAVETERTR